MQMKVCSQCVFELKDKIQEEDEMVSSASMLAFAFQNSSFACLFHVHEDWLPW